MKFQIPYSTNLNWINLANSKGLTMQKNSKMLVQVNDEVEIYYYQGFGHLVKTEMESKCINKFTWKTMENYRGKQHEDRCTRKPTACLVCLSSSHDDPVNCN